MSQEIWKPFQNIHQKVPHKVVNHQINGYAQANDFTQFAIYGRDAIYLIDFKTNYVQFKYDCYTSKWNLKYSEDSQWLMNSGMSTIYLMNCQFPKYSMQKSVYHNNAEFSKDSNFLIIFTRNQIKIENIRSKEIVRTVDLQFANISQFIYINFGAIVKENLEYQSKFKIQQHDQRHNYTNRVESLHGCQFKQLVILHILDKLKQNRIIYVRNICRKKLLRKFIENKPISEYTLKQKYLVITKKVYIFDITTGADADAYECTKYLPQLWRNNHMIQLHERKYLDQVIKYKENGLSKVSIALMTFEQPIKKFRYNQNDDNEYYGSDDSMEYYMNSGNNNNYDDDDYDYD